jgi:acyl-CoA synthetase (AMP-forming)/AMP-acid ligase II
MNLRDPNMTIAKLVDEVAVTYGRRKCLTYGHTTYTYTAVNRKINQVAHGLHRLGISCGSRIGLFLSNCPEYIFAYFGIIKFGCINVPINTFLESAELQFIVNDCEMSAIITDQILYDKVKYL